MATEKVTTMVLKVDLQCPACYKKTKKTLCKFPQIRDQIYDEKANTVTITVVCCCPEKIRNRLCCKGGKAIKSITIKEPAKPKEPEKPKETANKPKGPEKPKETDEKPKETADKPKVVIVDLKDAGKPKQMDKPKSNGKPDKPKPEGVPPAEKPNLKSDGVPNVEKTVEKPKEATKPEPAKNTEPIMIPFPVEPMKGPVPGPVQGVPSVFPYVGPSYDAYSAGPYYHGPGFAAPAQPVFYEGYYSYGQVEGYGVGYGPGRVANWNRGDSYFTEENPQVCSIM